MQRTCGICKVTGHNKSTCPKKTEAMPGATKEAVIAPTDSQWDTLCALKDILLEVAEGVTKGHSESVYQGAVSVELQLEGIPHSREENLSIQYKGVGIGVDRMDIFTKECKKTPHATVIELKAIAGHLNDTHVVQVVNYMREKRVSVGLLVNFSQSLEGVIEIRYFYSSGRDMFELVEANDFEPRQVPICDYV